MGGHSCHVQRNEDRYHSGGDIIYDVNNSTDTEYVVHYPIKHNISKTKDYHGGTKQNLSLLTEEDIQNSIFILTPFSGRDVLADKDKLFMGSCIKQAGKNTNGEYGFNDRPYNYIASGHTPDRIKTTCEAYDTRRYSHKSAICNSDDKGQLWYLYKGKLCSMKDDTCLKIHGYDNRKEKSPYFNGNYHDNFWDQNQVFLIPTNDKNYIHNTNDDLHLWEFENNKINHIFKTKKQYKKQIGTIHKSDTFFGTGRRVPIYKEFHPFLGFIYPDKSGHTYDGQSGFVIPIYTKKKKEGKFKSTPDIPIGGYWRLKDFCKNDEYTNQFNNRIKEEFTPVYNNTGIFTRNDIILMSKSNNKKYFPKWEDSKFPSESETCNWREKWKKIEDLTKGYIYLNNWCPFIYQRQPDDIDQCNYSKVVEAMLKCRSYGFKDYDCFPDRIEAHETLCDNYEFEKNDDGVYEGCTLRAIMVKQQEKLSQEIQKLNTELSESIDEFRRQNLENQKKQLEQQLELFKKQQESADKRLDMTVSGIQDITKRFQLEETYQNIREQKIKNTAILIGILLFIFIIFL
jgi:hypothetical protein